MDLDNKNWIKAYIVDVLPFMYVEIPLLPHTAQFT